MLFTEGFIFEKCMLTDGNVIGKRKEKKKKEIERTKKLCTKGAYKIRNFYAKSKIHEFTLPRKHKLIDG